MGTVRDEAGTAIAAARVFVTEGPGPFPDVAALTGEDGGFTLTLGVPGSYRLEFHAEGFTPASVHVTGETAEPSTVDVRLQPE
jgi:hypothetical protein